MKKYELIFTAVIRFHETRPTWVAVRHYEEKYYGGKKSSGALTSDELEQRVIKAVNKDWCHTLC